MTVHLVGAGPGDPELLTVRAMRLIASADVIVHDALASDEIIALARPGVELIDVGKKPGNPTPQELINTLLVHLGAQDASAVLQAAPGAAKAVADREQRVGEALVEAGCAIDVDRYAALHLEMHGDFVGAATGPVVAVGHLENDMAGREAAEELFEMVDLLSDHAPQGRAGRRVLEGDSQRGTHVGASIVNTANLPRPAGPLRWINRRS
mgnify:CR=1 FL=1